MRALLLTLLVLVLALGWVWPVHTPVIAARKAVPHAYAPDGRLIGPASEPTPRPNLVVIVLDTLRADCVGPRGDVAGDMPFLEGLAQQGAQLTNVTAPAVWTYPSLASFFTGLLPMEHGVWQSTHSAFLPRSAVTFAEALSAGHGYETATFTSVVLPGGHASMLQGFEQRRHGMTLRGTRQELERWAKERTPERPFFLLLHTYEAHAPYGAENHPWPEPPIHARRDGPAPNLHAMTDAELLAAYDLDYEARRQLGAHHGNQVLRRLVRYRGVGWSENPDYALARRLETAYRRGVRQMDAELEQTVLKLKTLGLLANSLLVITSDHGEAFGEHGVLAHGQTVHDELSLVPVVAVGPAPFQGGRTLSTSMALHDIMPTFFELAGLPALPATEGRSMLSALEADAPGRAALTFERFDEDNFGRYAGALLIAARTQREKYTITYDTSAGTIVEALFDLATDPGAHNDLLAATGRLDIHPVSQELAQAIETARDHIWTSAETSASFAQMGYGSGARTVEANRPPEPKTRAP